MELPFTVVFEPPTRADLLGLLRKPVFWAILVGLSGLALGGVRLRNAQHTRAMSEAGTLVVTSLPVGAEVALDGHAASKTPGQLTLSPGRHDLQLSIPGYIDEKSSVQVAPRETVAVQHRM